MIPILLSLLPLLLDITAAYVVNTSTLLSEYPSSTLSTLKSNSTKPKLNVTESANVAVVEDQTVSITLTNISNDFSDIINPKIEDNNTKNKAFQKLHNQSGAYQENKNESLKIEAGTKVVVKIGADQVVDFKQGVIFKTKNENNKVYSVNKENNDKINVLADKQTYNKHNREVRSGNSDEFEIYDNIRTTHIEPSEKYDLRMLSQVYNFNFTSSFSVNDDSKTKLEINNYVLSKNESLKPLGSVDVMVPSLKGMELGPSKSDLNSSRVTEGNKMGRNRSSSHLGRTDSPMLNYIFDTHSTLNKHHHRNDRFGGPRFETPGTSVSVDTEADANLDCKVSSLSDKLVSWVRKRPGYDKLEILTIGQQTYTADSRFSVDFLQPSTWRLVLRRAVVEDSGTYECQLSTHPPLISRHQLIVHAPVVEILEAAVDKYYERNSTLELGCHVRHLPTTAVNWLHQTRVLNDDTQRGGISVRIEAVAGGADSTLQVARLTASDGGRYTCSVREGLQASVNVHVLNGESLAELQQTAGTSRSGPFLPTTLALLSLTSSLLHQIANYLSYSSYTQTVSVARRIYLRL